MSGPMQMRKRSSHNIAASQDHLSHRFLRLKHNTKKMAEGIVWELAAKALESLGKSSLQEAASWWGAQNELKELEKTIKMIQARVHDAEKYQEAEDSAVVKEWLRRLKLVLYQADDLFDEVFTVHSKRQKMEGHKLVCASFLRSIPLSYYNLKMAQEIKSIRREFDAIKSDMAGLNLRAYDHREQVYPIAHLIKTRETAAFVREGDIIGRDNDKMMIIEMLLDPKYDGERVTVIPIVGFGGLGKTTLAQLVFNDESVQRHFDLTTWVCVPEVDDQNAVMRKLCRCFTDDSSDKLSLNQIKMKIEAFIRNKKYFLVMDDIWDESRDRWLDFMRLLECGRSGSKIIVTTRSDVVAKVVGTIPKAYKLGFLTDYESWDLFKRLAFKQKQEEINPNLVQMGMEIVHRCGNVPLAIRVIASLLYPKDSEKEWKLFRDDQLSKAKLMEDGNIMPVLKLSYDYLTPALKQCFRYCSLFPKDYEFKKANLIHLWMAQGYFEPVNPDIGDQYFAELLARNFFHNPKEDSKGNIKTFKIHELMHDLAQHVAADESKLMCESSTQFAEELLHASLNKWECPPSFVARKLRYRSLLFMRCHANLEELSLRFPFLRVLSLENGGVQKLPSSIGRLIHLRYLNLAWNCVECLPNSITRLENLQTLNLDGCVFLQKLPTNFARLANLRHLVINLNNLMHLPSDFGKMTSLHELDRFIVGNGKNTGIDSLPALNLKGELRIEFHKWNKNAVREAQMANLKYNQQLTSLTLDLSFLGEVTTPDSAEMERMISFLQLPPNLKYLVVDGYRGYNIPNWWLDELSKLISISLVSCNNCSVLPHLRRLPHLKYLYLESLNALEYIEDEDDTWVGNASGKSPIQNNYFPFLEVLELEEMPQLKGWTRPSNQYGDQKQLLFPRLMKMKLNGCLKLMSMPSAPKLESLEVGRINGKLFELNLTSLDDHKTPSSSSVYFTDLKLLKLHEIEDGLVILPVSSRLYNLETLEISKCHRLWSLMFESPNSIRHLRICDCKSLKNISDGKHLPALETLTIQYCGKLEEEDEEEGKTTEGWQGLGSLCSLELSFIPKLTKLPRGIDCLTSLKHLSLTFLENLTTLPELLGNLLMLRELRIIHCPNLALLPLSIQGLTSLQKLYVRGCPDMGRYVKPNGEDCHLLQHISHVDISTGSEISFNDLGFMLSPHWE